MNSFSNAHWIAVGRRAGRDAVLFLMGYAVAVLVRFDGFERVQDFAVPVLLGLCGFLIFTYIFGLFSIEARGRERFLAHALLLVGAFVAAFLIITLVGYVDFTSRVGRGVMALGVAFTLPPLLLHHWLMFNKHRLAPIRVAIVAESPAELEEYRRLKEMNPRGVEIVGRIGVTNTETGDDHLGRIRHASVLLNRHRIDRIAYAESRMQDSASRPYLRRLRYSGIPCVPLITFCEQYLEYVPLHLVTGQWFILSENTSRGLYFRKLKRSFDILTSLSLLVLLSPALLFGVALVKLFSPEGPLFFRQERVGRFGKKFQILKLRSMRTDAEKDGPKWSSASGDSRVFPGGALLRRFRIDEIPQLLNILRGDMSFVGPRPEQPAFVEKLAKTIPYYEERHMIPPGLTGWAQVCYPYGANVEDARCKLEYDLYYLKHAGVVFDLLILLDTVRVVLMGGLKPKESRPRYAADMTARAASSKEPITVSTRVTRAA